MQTPEDKTYETLKAQWDDQRATLLFRECMACCHRYYEKSLQYQKAYNHHQEQADLLTSQLKNWRYHAPSFNE